MLTWNRRDSTPLSAAPRAPKGDQVWKKARCEIWPKRSERRNNAKKKKKKNYQDEDKKSAINKKNNSQIKKPHLKMIPIKDKYKEQAYI